MGDWLLNSAGLYVPQRTRAIQAVDLFCGAGGMSLGMEAAGIDCVGALEYNPVAAITYLHNLGSPRGCAVSYASEKDQQRFASRLTRINNQRSGELATKVLPGDHGWIGAARPYPRADTGCRGMVIGDAREVTGQLIITAMEAAGWRGSIDLVTGGPPCQGFSRAGRQREGDPRNNLILEFLRLTDELDAGMFVMENVPPLLTSKKYAEVWDAYVKKANSLGYNIVANVLDASHYGVPQRRRRAIVLGSRIGVWPDFPLPRTWCFTSSADGTVTSHLERDLRDDNEEDTPEPKSEQHGLFD